MHAANANKVAWSVALLLIACGLARAEEGQFLIPKVTGRPEMAVFARPGWVDVFHRGYGEGISARIEADGTFDLPEPKKRPVALIVMFDGIETPPFVVPDYGEGGKTDVTIPVEYACVPEGYPSVNEQAFKAVRGRNLCQGFLPKATDLYGITLFDGPPPAEWGNQVHIGLYAGKIEHAPIALKDQVSPDPGFEGVIDRVTTNRASNDLLRAGWRHGNMPVVPGEKYLALVEGYRSHGGKQFEINTYARRDQGDGYPDGQALIDGQPIDGDLCILVFGNSHGQNVENQIRSEEWEVFLPGHRPSTNWGQSFISHGVSLAGISFWASAGDAGSALCEVRVREEGPWGKMLKPAKVTRGHEVSGRPFIRYPDTPAALPGYEGFYKEPHLLFQVAYLPGEIGLEAGKTYYVEVIPNKPLMMYVDGDFYQEGYAYYEGLKVERVRGGEATKHSKRWTLAMNIVTYAEPAGQPLMGGN